MEVSAEKEIKSVIPDTDRESIDSLLTYAFLTSFHDAQKEK